MGKLNKKFVPPLKSSENMKTSEKKQNTKIRRTKGNKSTGHNNKLVISFDYANIKKQCKHIQKAKKSIDDHSTRDTDQEFIFFEPMQATKKDDSSDEGHTAGAPESSQQHCSIQPLDDIGEVASDDVYVFTLSPTVEKEAGSVSCHAEKGKINSKGKRNAKKANKMGQIKKSVKRKVLKSLLQMEEDMVMLRARERALQRAEVSH